MARGKHKHASTGRRSAALADALVAARAELAAEQHLLDVAQAEAATLDGRKATLERLRAEQHELTQPELDYLAGQMAELRRAWEAEHVHEKELGEHWEHIVLRLLDMFGGRVDGWERLMELLSGRQATVVLDDSTKSLSPQARQALEFARGDRRLRRKSRLLDHTRHPLQDLLPADLAARLEDVLASERAKHAELSPDGSDAAEGPDMDLVSLVGVTDAGWDTIDPEALPAWHPMPWLRDPLMSAPSDIAQALGVVEADAGTTNDVKTVPPSQPTPAPVPAMAQATRQRLAHGDPKSVIADWSPQLRRAARGAEQHLQHPVAAWPVAPTAAAATSIARWYTLAGLGAWARAHGDGDARVAAFGEVAIGCAAAAPFWLPATQTADFFDSEPLTDFDDLRLPFPQVLLTFAEPIDLPATGVPATDELETALGVLDAAMLTERRVLYDKGPFELLGSASANLFGQPFTATVADTIALRGARVEALLLLGDSLGRLSDTMAWALAVPSATAGVLARVLVPASWSRSLWRDQILNAAAVTAWADWHEPVDPPARDDERTPPGHGDLGTGRAAWVLAVRATRTAAATSEPTGRQLPTHLRRGHWRRQRHGPRGALIKRVRIAPVVVNAHRRDIATRIYRLPEAAGERQRPADVGTPES